MYEMFEDLRIHRHILCIDLMSFYASVECVERGLDPKVEYLVVADLERGEGSVTLAATPPVKRAGLKSRGRLYEIDPKLRKKIKIVKPSMQKYVDYSIKINNIYRSLFDDEDLYVYSIDETFIDITNYLTLYATTPEKMALALKRKIFKDLGLHVTIGYGPNMVLAKFALDIESKHTENQIAIWTYDNFTDKLWPITDFTSVWGIGRGRAKRLRDLGITSIGELAKFPVEKMNKAMGVIGEELILHANGIDLSRVQDSHQLEGHKSLGVGQTLQSDVADDDLLNIIIEMLFDTVLKLRNYDYKCSGIALSLGFNKKFYKGGVHKHMHLSTPTSDYNTIKEEFADVFNQIYPRGIGVRKISISLTELEENRYEQMNLFNKAAPKRANLDQAILKIRTKYGKSSIMTANSKYDNATGYARNKLIGGHNAVAEKPEKD
ncbi:damage repair protein [Mollicutes bacterium LVI A0039]|nr:damage repair protein [Mollicutes bacterium LVI A0039]